MHRLNMCPEEYEKIVMTYSKQLHNRLLVNTSSNSTVMIYILLKYTTIFFCLLVVIGHPLKILLFPLKVRKNKL